MRARGRKAEPPVAWPRFSLLWREKVGHGGGRGALAINSGVSRFVRAAVFTAIAVVATGAGVLLISDEDGSAPDGRGAPVVRAPQPSPPGGATTGKPERPSRPHGDGIRNQVREAVEQSPSPRLDASQREVARVVSAYVAALNDRDGQRACGLFVSGALSGLDFPRDRGNCARSLSASVGYRDPRGFPVYERSRIARIPAVSIDGDTARVTATTVTRFADDREPSVEDDLVYLRREHGMWRIAKPSATLYRAIGAGDIPPAVLAPP
jgi:hypothetical protein